MFIQPDFLSTNSFDENKIFPSQVDLKQANHNWQHNREEKSRTDVDNSVVFLIKNRSKISSVVYQLAQ